VAESQITRLDKKQIRAAFDRAAVTYDEVAVLHRRIGDQILERLEVIKTEPKRILDVGCGTGYCAAALARRYRGAHVFALDIAHRMLQRAGQREGGCGRRWLIGGDAESLPLADASVDMVFSNLTLQWCDPAVVFREFARVLRPGGLLMFSSLGPDTLSELRRAWAAVDDNMHVHEFVDMHDLGDMLIETRFTVPVMDRESYTLTYRNVSDVLRELKLLGARNAAWNRTPGLTGKRRFERFRAAYEALRNSEGVLPVTYEVVYGHAWAPQKVASGKSRVPSPLFRMDAKNINPKSGS